MPEKIKIEEHIKELGGALESGHLHALFTVQVELSDPSMVTVTCVPGDEFTQQQVDTIHRHFVGIGEQLLKRTANGT